MTLRTVALTLVLLLALGTGGITAQDKVGTVHFATSCSAAVQQDFERAVAMLHSFWFSASTSAFTAVAQSDPACGIAHWGVAMNLLGNPFGWPPSPKALADGWAAVERAKTAGAKTQRERDYILLLTTDVPQIAEKGLNAARRYASIAPAAPHALHMPSHIFTRRGYWQEAIDANLASVASVGNHFDQLHALDYLTYAYLQTAQDAAAKRVVDQVSELPKVAVEHFVTAFALATIPSRYALERGRWADAAKLELLGREFPWGRFPQSEAQLVFARGLGAARGGDVASARRDVERLGALRDTLAAAKVGYWAEQVDIQRQVASAWLARAEGRKEEALALLRAAADREDATEKHPVTPGPIAPARELLAEMLLEANEPAQASREFEASMCVEPNRFRGLYGAARAADLSGDRTKARTYYSTLLSLGEKGDTERPELRQAKAFLGK